MENMKMLFVRKGNRELLVVLFREDRFLFN
jgi:hypothetical protein